MADDLKQNAGDNGNDMIKVLRPAFPKQNLRGKRRRLTMFERNSTYVKVGKRSKTKEGCARKLEANGVPTASVKSEHAHLCKYASLSKATHRDHMQAGVLMHSRNRTDSGAQTH